LRSPRCDVPPAPFGHSAPCEARRSPRTFVRTGTGRPPRPPPGARRVRSRRTPGRTPRPGSAVPLPPSASVPADLVDVALDERELRLAVQVAFDDPLCKLDRQVRYLMVQLGGGALGREQGVVLRPRPDLGRLGLGLGPDLALHLVGGLARFFE